MRFLLSSLLVIGLTGCTSSRAPPAVVVQKATAETTVWRSMPSGKPNVRRVEVDTQGGSNVLALMVRSHETVTAENVREALRDRTRITIDDVHGQQIEYTSAEGKAYLWYPGNTTILRGRWKPEAAYVEFLEKGRVLRRVEESKICFDYGPGTFNPATGHTGAGWECAPFSSLPKYPYRNVQGDIFGLSGRTDVPFVLRRDRSLSIEDLQSRIGS